MVAITATAVAALYVIADRIIEDVLEIESAYGQLLEVAIMAVITSAVLWTVVLRPLHQQATADNLAAESWLHEVETTSAQQRFESQFHRALEMATTEVMVYRSTRKALAAVAADIDAEVLLADSSDAHLKRVLAVDEAGPARCEVIAPHDCPAIRRAQTLVFGSSGDLDACPHLEDRPTGPCSAACVPVSVGGRSIGVLHAVSAPDSPPATAEVERLESVANQAGSRIGMIRVMSATIIQAATDPLTGLLNRRSFEEQANALLRSGASFALAMGDLDHFKILNDTHGHEAGDRALRLFARTMRSALRDDDLISRYGGEEFIVIFVNRTAEEAADALRRLQEELVVALAAGAVPGFTASFGVSHSDSAGSLEELSQLADAALFQAKRDGRDRIVLDASSTSPVVGTDAPTEQPVDD